MQNSENNYDGAERKEGKKNKIIIFNSKKVFGKGSFIYDVHKKSLNFGAPSPTYPQTSYFGLNSAHSWTFLIGIPYLPPGNF